MENYELNISTPPKRINNWFPKGHIPFNKDKKWTDYLDMRKARRMKKNLEIGRKLGNKNLPDANRRTVVAIKDGKLTAYRSATDAAIILQSKGIKINRRNICAVCHGKRVMVGKYSYIRKKAGGYQWFFAEDIEKYKDLMQQN